MKYFTAIYWTQKMQYKYFVESEKRKILQLNFYRKLLSELKISKVNKFHIFK